MIFVNASFAIVKKLKLIKVLFMPCNWNLFLTSFKHQFSLSKLITQYVMQLILTLVKIMRRSIICYNLCVVVSQIKPLKSTLNQCQEILKVSTKMLKSWLKNCKGHPNRYQLTLIMVYKHFLNLNRPWINLKLTFDRLYRDQRELIKK